MSIFGRDILPFDPEAAVRCPRIVLDRHRSGRPLLRADARIAAVCAALGVRLATRNVADFAGVDLVDPWTTSS